MKKFNRDHFILSLEKMIKRGLIKLFTKLWVKSVVIALREKAFATSTECCKIEGCFEEINVFHLKFLVI